VEPLVSADEWRAGGRPLEEAVAHPVKGQTLPTSPAGAERRA